MNDDSKRRAAERVLHKAGIRTHKAGMRNVEEVTGKTAEQIENELEAIIEPSEETSASEVGEKEKSVLDTLEDVSDAAQAYISRVLEDADELEALSEKVDMDSEDPTHHQNQALEDAVQHLTEDLSELLEGLAEVAGGDVVDEALKEVISQIESELAQLSPEDMESYKEYISRVVQGVGNTEALMRFSNKPLVGDVSSEEPIEDFSPDTLTSVHQISEKDADELIDLLLL